MRNKTIAAAIFTALALAGCGQRENKTSETSSNLPDIQQILEGSGENGFLCEISQNLKVSWFPSEDGPTEGMWDSFYANYTSNTPEERSGLEILTIDGVSYARWLGSSDGIETPQRRELVEKLDGQWATWGQPDTITLEELPSSAAECMDWTTVESYENVRQETEGQIEFDAVFQDGTETARAPGMILLDNGVAREFDIKLERVSGENIKITFQRPEYFMSNIPENPIEVTQDEYFALVGG